MVLDGAHHMGSWAGAVCLPSRTMVQTSINVWRTQDIAKRYPRMNPKTYVHQPRKLLAELTPNDPDYDSMPALFYRAGYDTYRTCKIGNTYEGANRLYLGRKDQTNYGPEDETGSWWHGEQVMNYLKEREKEAKEDPFLLFFGFTHPHDPRHGKPDLLDKYGADNTDIPASPNPKAPPLQENYLPAHPFHHGHPGLRDEVAVQECCLREMKPPLETSWDENMPVSRISIGRLVESSKSSRQWANWTTPTSFTLLIMVSPWAGTD